MAENYKFISDRISQGVMQDANTIHRTENGKIIIPISKDDKKINPEEVSDSGFFDGPGLEL